MLHIMVDFRAHFSDTLDLGENISIVLLATLQLTPLLLPQRQLGPPYRPRLRYPPTVGRFRIRLYACTSWGLLTGSWLWISA